MKKYFFFFFEKEPIKVGKSWIFSQIPCFSLPPLTFSVRAWETETHFRGKTDWRKCGLPLKWISVYLLRTCISVSKFQFTCNFSLLTIFSVYRNFLCVARNILAQSYFRVWKLKLISALRICGRATVNVSFSLPSL